MRVNFLKLFILLINEMKMCLLDILIYILQMYCYKIKRDKKLGRQPLLICEQFTYLHLNNLAHKSIKHVNITMERLRPVRIMAVFSL